MTQPYSTTSSKESTTDLSNGNPDRVAKITALVVGILQIVNLCQSLWRQFRPVKENSNSQSPKRS